MLASPPRHEAERIRLRRRARPALSLRCWGDPQAPKLFLLHGWMDVSASFQFLVDALRGDWRVIAPDWRGYGLIAVERRGQLLVPRLPRRPRRAAVAALARRAGDARRPQHGRQRRLPLCGHPAGARSEAREPRGLRPARQRSVAGAGALRALARRARRAAAVSRLRELRRAGARLRRGIRASRASVRCSSRSTGGRQRPTAASRCASDPAHKRVNPVLYRIEEAEACWREVTAPVLWVEGAESQTLKWLRLDPAAYEARKRCFATLIARTHSGRRPHAASRPAGAARVGDRGILAFVADTCVGAGRPGC